MLNPKDTNNKDIENPFENRPLDEEKWYAGGLNFGCTGCGRCCSGVPGIVEFTPDEAKLMAKKLNVSMADFENYYTEVLEDGVVTLAEHPPTEDGYDCIMLYRAKGKAGASCKVYNERPRQCRTWPFWPEVMRSDSAWNQASKRCPGINRGKHFTQAEIDDVLYNNKYPNFQS